jgi:hypothetical protein
MSGPSSERLTYRINPDDIIEFVNDAWVRFALENGTPSLSQGVIGSSLWKYISGPQVVHLSRELLARVRESHCEATVPFRCDSPTMRRFMRMKILPLGKSKVEFGTWIEREEPYRQPIQLLDPTIAKGQEKLLRMCAWCKKIDVAGSWHEIEDAIGRLRLFDDLAIPAITHGMCDDCLKAMTTEFGPNLCNKKSDR